MSLRANLTFPQFEGSRVLEALEFVACAILDCSTLNVFHGFRYILVWLCETLDLAT